jgi:hypothetical protein
VANIVNHTIFIGDYLNVAVGSQETQQSIIRNVRMGDFNSLREALLSFGLLTVDIEDLNNALKEDPPVSTEAGLGPRTKAWLREASRKLAGSAGDAAMGTVFQALAKAVAAYAGIDLDLTSPGSPS